MNDDNDFSNSEDVNFQNNMYDNNSSEINENSNNNNFSMPMEEVESFEENEENKDQQQDSNNDFVSFDDTDPTLLRKQKIRRLMLVLIPIIVIVMALIIYFVVQANKTAGVTIKDMVVKIGEEQVIETSISDKDKLVWTSTDPTIASVTAGKVKGLKEGTVIIKVKPKGGKTSKVLVTVISNLDPLAFKDEIVELNKGEEKTLEITGAKPEDVEWSSSNTNVATVEGGVVKALHRGSCYISIKPQDEREAVKIRVNVKSDEVLVEKLVVNDIEVGLGAKANASFTTIPNNALKIMTYSIVNEEIAKVDAKGVITGISEGETILEITDYLGKTARGKVTVREIPVKKVTLNNREIILTPKQTYSLKISYEPSNATTKKTTWSSSNNTVATVNASGKVTAKAIGSATIKAQTANGLSTTCTVKVVADKNPVTGITLATNSVTMKNGSSYHVSAAITPSNATNKSISWSSSNTSVATVSGGTIYARGVGSATITAMTSNGKKATVHVTVTSTEIPVTSIKLNSTSMTLARGQTANLVATVSPSNATNKKITYTSSNGSVATIDNKGKIKAVNVGTTTITVSSGNKTARCTVKVVSGDIIPESIGLSNTSLTIKVGTKMPLRATVYPKDSTNQTITWSSTNSAVAEYDAQNYWVVAKKAGKATISAKTYNGKRASCEVTVVN